VNKVQFYTYIHCRITSEIVNLRNLVVISIVDHQGQGQVQGLDHQGQGQGQGLDTRGQGQGFDPQGHGQGQGLES